MTRIENFATIDSAGRYTWSLVSCAIIEAAKGNKTTEWGPTEVTNLLQDAEALTCYNEQARNVLRAGVLLAFDRELASYPIGDERFAPRLSIAAQVGEYFNA